MVEQSPPLAHLVLISLQSCAQAPLALEAVLDGVQQLTDLLGLLRIGPAGVQ